MVLMLEGQESLWPPSFCVESEASVTGLNRGGEVGEKVFVGDVELSSSKGAAVVKSQPITLSVAAGSKASARAFLTGRVCLPACMQLLPLAVGFSNPSS